MSGDCSRYQDSLLDYLYDLLEPAEAAALLSHLQGCPQCAQEMERARRQQELLGLAARRQFPDLRFVPPQDLEPLLLWPVPAHQIAWKPWALAAGILLLLTTVAVPLAMYLQGRAELEQSLQQVSYQLRQLGRVEVALRGQAPQADHAQTAAAEATNQNAAPAPAPPGPGSDAALRQAASAQAAGERKQAAVQDRGVASDFASALSAQAGIALSVQGQQSSAPGPQLLAHLATDKTRYRPGETIHYRAILVAAATLRSDGSQSPPDVSLLLLDSRGAVHAGPLPLERLAAHRQLAMGHTAPPTFSGAWTIPGHTPPGRYELVLQEPGRQFPEPRVVVEIGGASSWTPLGPAAPTPRQVRLFPEGGNLVAGVENVVYVRVSGTGAEAPVAELLDDRGQPVLHGEAPVRCQLQEKPSEQASSARNRFVFVPAAGRQYHLRVRWPDGGETLAPLPEVRSDGVSLRAEPGVVAPGEPIRLVLASVGADRRVAVSAACRGQQIGQRRVALAAGRSQSLELPVRSGIAGACLVTVQDLSSFPPSGPPLAQRYVFLRPAELDIAVTLTQEPAIAGRPSRATLHLTAADPHGRRIPAWATLSVVSIPRRELLAAAAGPSLPARFYLGYDLPADDVALAESAPGLWRDGSGLLDWLLATQPPAPRTLPEESTYLTLRERGGGVPGPHPAAGPIQALPGAEQERMALEREQDRLLGELRAYNRRWHALASALVAVLSLALTIFFGGVGALKSGPGRWPYLTASLCLLLTTATAGFVWLGADRQDSGDFGIGVRPYAMGERRPYHPEDLAATLTGSPEASQPEPTGPNAAKDRTAPTDPWHGLPHEPDQKQTKTIQEALGGADKPSSLPQVREHQRQVHGTGAGGPAATRRGAEALRKTERSSVLQGPGAPAAVPEAHKTDSGTAESQPPSAAGASAPSAPLSKASAARGADAWPPPVTLLWQPLVPLSQGACTVDLVLPPDAGQVIVSAHILTADGRCASVRLPVLPSDHRP